MGQDRRRKDESAMRSADPPVPRCPHCGETRAVEPIKVWGRIVEWYCSVCSKSWKLEAESMSIKTWRQEFYPVSAKSREAKQAPAAHSLRKWLGLRKEALKRHGLTLDAGALLTAPWACRTERGTMVFEIDDRTCALCAVHQDDDFGTPRELRCSKNGACPLIALRRGLGCYESESGPYRRSPYNALIIKNNPEPMIRLLSHAVRKEQKKKDEEREPEP